MLLTKEQVLEICEKMWKSNNYFAHVDERNNEIYPSIQDGVEITEPVMAFVTEIEKKVLKLLKETK